MNVIREGLVTEDMLIRNVVGTVDENNKAVITWEWPKRAELNLCAVFSTQGDEPLEELLRRKAPMAVYEDSFGLRHIAEIEKLSVQYKVFAARKLPNGNLEIVNQAKGNTSKVFYKRVNLYYHIDYRSFLLHGIKRVTVKLVGLNEMGDEYIAYRCTGRGRDNLLYPIDLEAYRQNQVFMFTVDRNEEVEIVLSDKQKEYINLINN